MKKFALFSLLAAAAFMIAPKPAQAGDKGLAILGGVIGGLIIADALDGDSHHHTTVSVGHHDGYWHDSSYDVWIEGRWIVTHHGHRHSTRHFVPGHYETRVRRVWVSGHRKPHRVVHYDRRHDRRHGDSRRHRNDDRHDRRDRRDRR